MNKTCVFCALPIKAGTESWLTSETGVVAARHLDCGNIIGQLVDAIETFLEAETDDDGPIQFTTELVADLAHDIRDALFADGVS